MAQLRATSMLASTSAPLKKAVCPVASRLHAVSRSPARIAAPFSGPATQRCLVLTSAKGGVLEGPLVLPSREKSLEHKEKKPPIYKVMLHNDNYNRREYVVKILINVVKGFTVDDAVVVMQEAHETGVALVIACAQEAAERYCETLRLNGLTCTIEPGSGGSLN